MERIGEYEVIRELGSGGMGQVFLCRHPRLPLEVAVKLLFEQADDRARERFEREADTMASLQDASIVVVQDKGLHGRQPYIVMQYVPGEDLTSLIAREAPLDPERALEITRRILRGLAYAHSRGVIHRDIKPSNIRVGPEDQVKILDFGIAHLRDRTPTAGGATLTRIGLQPGTDDYMSPEQVKGLPVDPRSDLFSTAIVLYEMLTAKHPFRHKSAEATRRHIANEDPAPPRQHRADLPLPVCWLVLHVLERQPENRLASAEEFADHCRRLGKEFLRGSLKAGASWREPEALAGSDPAELEVLAREAEFAGDLERARHLFGGVVGLEPSWDRVHERLDSIADATARTAEIQSLLRDARQALDEGRIPEAEKGLQKIRLLDREWKSNPKVQELYQELQRRRSRTGEGSARASGEGGTSTSGEKSSSSQDAGQPVSGEPGAPTRTPVSGESAAPVSGPGSQSQTEATSGEAPSRAGATAAQPAPPMGAWRSAPPIPEDPQSASVRLRHRIVDLFKKDDHERAWRSLMDLARDHGRAEGVQDFHAYWQPKIQARKMYQNAEARYKQGRLEEALKLCEEALRIDSSTARALNLRTRIELEVGAVRDREKLQECCDEANELLRKFVDLGQGESTLLPRARMLVRAEKLLREALEIDARSNRAVALLRTITAHQIRIPEEILEGIRTEQLETKPEEDGSSARLKAEVAKIQDPRLSELVRAGLEGLLASPPPDAGSRKAALETFDRSLQALLQRWESLQQSGSQGWVALADTAGGSGNSEDPLASAHHYVSAQLRDRARKAAEESLKQLAQSKSESLEQEIARVLAHPELAPHRAELQSLGSRLQEECRKREAEKKEEGLRQEGRRSERDFWISVRQGQWERARTILESWTAEGTATKQDLSQRLQAWMEIQREADLLAGKARTPQVLTALTQILNRIKSGAPAGFEEAARNLAARIAGMIEAVRDSASKSLREAEQLARSLAAARGRAEERAALEGADDGPRAKVFCQAMQSLETEIESARRRLESGAGDFALLIDLPAGLARLQKSTEEARRAWWPGEPLPASRQEFQEFCEKVRILQNKGGMSALRARKLLETKVPPGWEREAARIPRPAPQRDFKRLALISVSVLVVAIGLIAWWLTRPGPVPGPPSAQQEAEAPPPPSELHEQAADTPRATLAEGADSAWIYGPVGSTLSLVKDGQPVGNSFQLPTRVELPQDQALTLRLKLAWGEELIASSPVNQISEVQSQIDQFSASAPNNWDSLKVLDSQVKTWVEAVLEEGR